MLRAVRRGFFTSNYSVVSEDGEQIATIDWAWFREAGNVVLAGESYRFSNEGMFERSFALQQGDAVLAKARCAGLCSRAFNITSEGVAYQLTPSSWWSYQYSVFQEQTPIGTIQSEGWTAQTYRVDLPAEVPLHLQVFLLWLVLVVKRRADQSSSG